MGTCYFWYLLLFAAVCCWCSAQNILQRGTIRGKGLLCNKCRETQPSVTSCTCRVKGVPPNSNSVCQAQSDNIAECLCKRGYKFINQTSSRCVDIDECAEVKDACSDNCRNKLGNFECSCKEGRVAVDARTCKDATFFEQNFTSIVVIGIAAVVILLLVGGCCCLLISKQQIKQISTDSSLIIEDIIGNPPPPPPDMLHRRAVSSFAQKASMNANMPMIQSMMGMPGPLILQPAPSMTPMGQPFVNMANMPMGAMPFPQMAGQPLRTHPGTTRSVPSMGPSTPGSVAARRSVPVTMMNRPLPQSQTSR